MDRLVSIRDPGTSGAAGIGGIANILERTWLIEYWTSGSTPPCDLATNCDKIEFIKSPLRSGVAQRDEIKLDWYGPGWIKTMADERNPVVSQPVHAYAFTYNALGLAERVTDPTPPVGNALYQEFSTTCIELPHAYTVDTNYRDRRASIWRYESFRPDPANKPWYFQLAAIENPLSQLQEYSFNSQNLLIQVSDALLNGWNYTHDAMGNRLSAIDLNDADREHYWSYDVYNNVQSYTDPLNNVTNYRYHYQNTPTPATPYPTLLTKITEPPAQSGGAAADTIMDYWIGNGAACVPISGGSPTLQCKNGLLKQVTDPRGVKTFFDYDKLGQKSSYGEGLRPPLTADSESIFDYVYQETYTNDARSRQTGSNWNCTLESSALASAGPGAGGGGTIAYNSEDDATGSSCPPGAATFFEDPPAAPLYAPPSLPTAALGPQLPRPYANWTGTYDGLGRVTTSQTTYPRPVNDPTDGLPAALCNRNPCLYDNVEVYDELNLMTDQSTTIDQQNDDIVRDFGYDYQLGAGSVTRLGPDDVETFTQYDLANRVSSFRRGPSGSPLMSATYVYFANGLLSSAAYANGWFVDYVYDSSNRLTDIWHNQGITDLMLSYVYDDRDLPVEIVESTVLSGVLATTTYDYDNRGRLVHEKRTEGTPPVTVYELTYTYDNGGNRTKKVNTVTGREMRYTYDVDDPAQSSSKNNRLLFSQEVLTATPTTVYSTTWYTYNCGGNVERVVTQGNQSAQYSSTRFSYAKNQRSVSFALAETWDPDGADAGTEVDNYAVQWLREFRYDSPRARYMNRKFTGTSVTANPSNIAAWVVESQVWTDYDGVDAYGDFTMTTSSPFVAVDSTSYEPGIGLVQPWAASGNANTLYYHTDHLGTTRQSTSGTGVLGTLRVFTAFGERIAGPTPPDRYGYVGAHGYQTHDDMPFQHLGARYYDPSSGRFLQRDPIGISGGNNVYNYANGTPTSMMDPSGLTPCPTCGHDPDGSLQDRLDVGCGWFSMKLRDWQFYIEYNRNRFWRWYEWNVPSPIDDFTDWLFPEPEWPQPPPPPSNHEETIDVEVPMG